MTAPASTPPFITADPDSYFSRMLRGDIPKPPVLTLLGNRVDAVDAAAGTLSATYEAKPDFRNPAGTVQGGMLGAMLDDLTASLIDATLPAGFAPATLSLNLSYLRPATVGPISGNARIQRRGKDVCHVSGTLTQDGREIATAQAVCKIIAV